MFRKMGREIAVFIFSTGLVVYVLIYCFLRFLIDLFIGTNLAKSIFFIQKSIDLIVSSIGKRIIEKLGKKGMWY